MHPVIDTCVLPVLLYVCEQWHLTETSLVRLDCLVGELCKRVLKLPKWFCNTPARIVMGLPSMRAHALPGDETMLVILRKLTDGIAESASLLGARMLRGHLGVSRSGTGVCGAGGVVWHKFHCSVQLRLASSPVLVLDSPPERGEEKSLVHIDCACAGFASV